MQHPNFNPSKRTLKMQGASSTQYHFLLCKFGSQTANSPKLKVVSKICVSTNPLHYGETLLYILNATMPMSRLRIEPIRDPLIYARTHHLARLDRD